MGKITNRDHIKLVKIFWVLVCYTTTFFHLIFHLLMVYLFIFSTNLFWKVEKLINFFHLLYFFHLSIFLFFHLLLLIFPLSYGPTTVFFIYLFFHLFVFFHFCHLFFPLLIMNNENLIFPLVIMKI